MLQSYILTIIITVFILKHEWSELHDMKESYSNDSIKLLIPVIIITNTELINYLASPY